MTDSTIPRAALILGFAGLLPTIAALAVVLGVPEWRDGAARAGLAYGALIASFVGGAWWGLAAVRADGARLPRLLSISVLPSLIAWPTLLVPAPAGLIVLGLLFATLLPTDRRLLREGLAPGWWMGLRLPLSLGMAALHGAAALVLLLAV